MWVVMVQVKEHAKWNAHGPFQTFNDARDYEHGLAGFGMHRQIVRLTEPWKSNMPREPQNGST